MSTPPSALRLILFDLDDTLCDYAGARARRLCLAFTPALTHAPAGTITGLDRLIADSLAMHPHGTDHFADLLRRYGIADPAVAHAAADWYRANRFHGLALFADARHTLAALRRGRPGRRIGLVTNGPAEVQCAKIELLGLGPLVDFAVVSGEFGAWKPGPAIFAEALRLGAATAAESVFVGDSPAHDMAGARAAGIRAIWMNRTGRPWPAGLPPSDGEIGSLFALASLLREAPGAAQSVGADTRSALSTTAALADGRADTRSAPTIVLAAERLRFDTVAAALLYSDGRTRGG